MCNRVFHVWRRIPWNLSNSGEHRFDVIRLRAEPRNHGYANLRDFIGKRKRKPANQGFCLSRRIGDDEIQTSSRERCPAVLFENVVDENGSPQNMPVLTNLFGTVERVAWGIKSPEELREFGEQLASWQPEPPGGWREAMEMSLLKTVMAMKPKSVKSPAKKS